MVVPSFVHYLEVLEGSDGDKVPGMICGKLVIRINANLFDWLQKTSHRAGI